jgi:DNA (cytosine-5)-methyltransferase 1
MVLGSELSSVEICAGAGGQALGLELAGFGHDLVVEIDAMACATLRANRPSWTVHEQDVQELSGRQFKGIDLFAGGVPCPPFSVAGRQLGAEDERDLFPTALRLIEEARPQAVLLENVPGLASARFADYRKRVIDRLTKQKYQVWWQVVTSSSYGVPQLRPRFILVAIRGKAADYFAWPQPTGTCLTVGDSLSDLMSSRGWRGASRWVKKANGVAPTIVGGSKKHGGPDLGPTRARERWLQLGVDGIGIANEAPGPELPIKHIPRLTVRMGARIQGFPDSWSFTGRKTAAWRQVGNAFPPPVAEAIGAAIRDAIHLRKPQAQPEQTLLTLRQG